MKVLLMLFCFIAFASPIFSQEESAPAEAIRILSESPDFKLSFYRVYNTPPETDSSVFGTILTLQGQNRYVGGTLNVWVIGQPHHFTLQLKDCVVANTTQISCKSSESEIPLLITITRTKETVGAGLVPNMLLVLKATKACEPKATNCAEEYVMTKDDILRFSNLDHVRNSQLKKLVEKEFNYRIKK